jgi:hypothetical protein
MKMKCPNCGQEAITFIDWAKGMQWYKTNCMSCHAELTANATTAIGFILAVVLGGVGGGLAIIVFDTGLLMGLLAVVAPIVIVIALITWFVGGYNKSV